MLRRFVKMHGCGNDFVIFDDRSDATELSPDAVRRLADRHRGIGFDQLIRLQPATDASAVMEIHNPDGSKAGACGNAARCVADILMRETDCSAVTIRTVSGLLAAQKLPDGQIAVDMGVPRFDWRDLPLAKPSDTLHIPLPGDPAGVSMGNPHATFFVKDLNSTDIASLGPRHELDPIFPDRANIGFAEVIDKATIRLRVWERGAGLTLACGSGACAALVNACRRGLVDKSARISVDGGELQITWRDDGHVEMAGPATHVFSGEIDLS